jgi:hypothetical protein
MAHHSTNPSPFCHSNVNPGQIHQSITNPPIHHQSANTSPIRQFNVNPSPIHQFISNPSIHHQSANPSPIQSQSCVNPSIQRFDKLINMTPINGQSHASTIKNSIDTGSARIGTHHANPLPIGDHFRKGTGNKCTIGEPNEVSRRRTIRTRQRMIRPIHSQSIANPSPIHRQSIANP